MPEIEDIIPWHISFVEKPANKRRFLKLMSGGGDDMEALQERAAKLGLDMEKLANSNSEDIADLLNDLEEAQKQDDGDEYGYPLPTSAAKKLKDIIQQLGELIGYGSKAASDDETETDSGERGDEMTQLPDEAEAKIAEAEEKAAAAEEQMAELEDDRREQKLASQFDELVSDGYLTPAAREELQPVVKAMSAEKRTVKLADSDDPVDIAEAVTEALRENGKIAEEHFETQTKKGSDDGRDAWDLLEDDE